MPTRPSDNLYARIRAILESAKSNVARSVNTTQVVANWLIGREIVEEEQHGKQRAGYGERLLRDLSAKMTRDYGQGWSVRQLEYVRTFYVQYGQLLDGTNSNAVRSISSVEVISNALRAKSPKAETADKPAEHASGTSQLVQYAGWQPGRLHPNLAWTSYRRLMRVEDMDARAFYEIEAIKSNWSARELERQINSLLYERIAMSKDKKEVLRLAKRGQQVQTPTDIFKDPVVLEFLGLPESPKLVESDLEQSLIDNLQAFLLELGKGFAFVARQQRLTLDGDHFYIDLVFYHTILKCYIVIDLKTGKLTHQDLGQLQLYVNYYDRECRTAGDGPTLGLILCTDKNDAVVRYTLGESQSQTVFASRYKLHVPSAAELRAQLRKELRQLREERA